MTPVSYSIIIMGYTKIKAVKKNAAKHAYECFKTNYSSNKGKVCFNQVNIVKLY